MIQGAELELFAASLRRATERHSGEALDAALVEAGWPEALEDDPRAAVSTLFELQGRANVTSSALGHVVMSALGRATGAGNAGAAVVLPALGASHPPGGLDGDRVSVRGLAIAPLADHKAAVVVVGGPGEEQGCMLPTAELTFRAVRGIDPALGLVEVTGHTARTEPFPAAWPAAVVAGQLAVGHELVGAARKMLELAREHALTRSQFGRPIAGFQAVRHRLADSLVAIEAGEAMLGAAWEDRSPVTAAMAKAVAGRGARTTVRHCQQVLAGIGFTTEHPFHRYVRRVLVLDQLLGAARSLTAELGEALLRSRRLPAMPPL